MSDTPIDILRRISERKRAFREYEINELNELTKNLKSATTPSPAPASTRWGSCGSSTATVWSASRRVLR